MADEFDEQPETMTIQEYIEEMEEQEMAVDMVLGGDEGKECTYSKGYMKRQAVFSCLTCVPDGNAGVCTACSISCHDGHEIVELWTKRNFRCDCGNSKFGSFYCKLSANKDPENEKNSYNQNFKGSYCNCGRPYPDPEAEEQEEMIQCCICEDWFHESHLGFDPSKEIPRNEGGVPLYDELICRHCAVTCSFLKLYPANIFVALKQKNVSINDNKENVLDCGSVSADPVKSENGVPDSLSLVNCSSTHSDSKSEHNVDNSLEENTAGGLDAEKTNTCCVDMSSNSTCTLGVDINAMQFIAEEAQAMILSKGWREFLCRCITCSGFYTKMGVGYLIDKEDTIEEYEKMAKQKREENLQRQEGDGMNFLNGLGHVQKVEILSAIDDMKTELGSFLGSFDTSQAVTPEDVRVFFENLSKKKRRRLQ